MRFVFFILLFQCIVWTAFFNVCLLVNSLCISLSYIRNSLSLCVVWNLTHSVEATRFFFNVLLELLEFERGKPFSNSKKKIWIQIWNEYAYETTICIYEQDFEDPSKFFDGSRFIAAHHQCRMFVFSGVRF